MARHPEFRLQLDDDKLAVQAFFNRYSDEDFLNIVQQVLDGVTGTPDANYLWEADGVGCALPSYPDEDIREGGMLFFLPFEDVWLPNEEVLIYLSAAVRAHLNAHPKDESLGLRVLENAERILG